MDGRLIAVLVVVILVVVWYMWNKKKETMLGPSHYTILGVGPKTFTFPPRQPANIQ